MCRRNCRIYIDLSLERDVVANRAKCEVTVSRRRGITSHSTGARIAGLSSVSLNACLDSSAPAQFQRWASSLIGGNKLLIYRQC